MNENDLNSGVGDWVHRRRIKSAGLVALIHRGRDITYEELDERINRLANALASRGVEKGDRVAYLGNNHPAFIETLFACTSIGAIFVPLNTRLAAAEIGYALRDSGARMFVYASSLEVLAKSGAEFASFQGDTLVVADGQSTPSPAYADADAYADAYAYAYAYDYDHAIAGAEGTRLEADVSLADPAMIVYTSGTTGRPKGAVLSHGNITWNSLNVLIDYDITSSERALMIAPLFHVAALGMGCFATLLKGGTVILEEKFEPGNALALIERYGVTMVSGVPTTFQLLCEHPDWDSTDLSTLQNLTCGGSAVPTRVLDEYERRGLSFSQGYGMTETAPGVTSLQPRYSRSKSGSVGLPHFFTSVRVANEAGLELGHGEVGEIQVKGPNTISGYWEAPEALSSLYTPDGWLRTGDLGLRDEQGFLYIADRLKDMIISGGENVYSAEVEQAIMELEEIEAAAVIGVPDEKWGEVPHAVITLAPGSEFDEQRMRSHLEARLARYKIPKSFAVAEELPRTASGKVRKNELRP
jgi:fatty-acyl-CoA synthase